MSKKFYKNKNKQRNNVKSNRSDCRKDSDRTYTSGKFIDEAMKARPSLDSIVSNDIAWWNRSPLFPLATRIPWNQVMGANTEVQNPGMSYTHVASQPGLMTVDFVPTIGWASDMNSAVNRAFNMLYADITAHTTGYLQMQQMDLAMMVVGVSSIACHLGYAKKVMGAYQDYASLNYYMPKGLISSLGIDFDDLVDNAANYQIELTDLINRFNRLTIPNFSDLHVRQYALSHNLYSDSETVFGQITNFRPVVIYRFDDGVHELQPLRVWNVDDQWEVITMGQYLGLIRTCLMVWENSSVTPIVAGNVRRAYPEGSFVQIDQFDPTAKVLPKVDRNIMWQINNMRWAPIPLDTLRIYQEPDTNILVCQPYWEFDVEAEAKASALRYFVINSYDGTSNEEFIMEATRLLPAIDLNYAQDLETGKYVAPLTDCSSELVVRVTVFTRMIDPDTGVAFLAPFTLKRSDFVANENDLFEDVAPLAGFISTMCKWRNGPAVNVHWIDSANVPALPFVCDSREINLYTHLHQDQLTTLNLAGSQSMYWAQGFHVGKSNTVAK